MNLHEVFNNAIWLTSTDDAQDAFILRGRFTVHNARKAMIRVVGLGFFHCYINGQRISEDLFQPLNSEFEPRKDYPVGEKLTSHHLYVPEYDITPLLINGDNVITVHFGSGWYCRTNDVAYGRAKAIWRIWGEDENGAFDFASSTADRILPSYVQKSNLVKREVHDYANGGAEWLAADADDSAWPQAVPARAPETEYDFTDCPYDRVIRTLPVQKLYSEDGVTVYDCGLNTTGYPVFRLHAAKGERVEVSFSEELTQDGKFDPAFTHNQYFHFAADGTERIVEPAFTWFGFRYFAVKGDAEPGHVQVIHTNVEQASGFASDNELLNWLHDTFLNTQLTNMHAGIPSDCPHNERRGYTGDGQLICHTAMNMLDAEPFYRKWMQDIADSQDVHTGHIQYTAPYVRSGGGPGGWGCAIVEVPWQHYRHYGDASVLAKYYPAMKRYFDYLESRSRNDLVITDKEGEWCLGDWCPPVSVVLPAPFVNNYFYIKSMERCIAICRLIGCEEDIPLYEERIARRKQALMDSYFNKWDDNFLGNVQGSNAFMLDIGLGSGRTYHNMVEHYRKLGRFDTGIFGTDILTRILFERGDGQLAVDLLLSDDYTSFDGMRKQGATTLYEYWPGSLTDRSHNHPMFGAVVAYLYDYLLGIRAKDGCAAYREIEIAPVLVDQLSKLSGWRVLPAGKVSVSYEKTETGVSFVIEVPEHLPAVFVYGGKEYELTAGENRFQL